MTDLSWDEKRDRIHRTLVENSARFHRKIIVYEGMAGWGAIRQTLFDALEPLGWWRDGDSWQPPAGVEFAVAYEALCAAVPPAPGMSRENLQPIIEGSYPEGEVWFEQFGSYPELRVEDEALVFHPAPMTPMQHVRLLKDRAEVFRMAAMRSDGTPASSIAQELEQRAEDVGRENALPSAAGSGRYIPQGTN